MADVKRKMEAVLTAKDEMSAVLQRASTHVSGFSKGVHDAHGKVQTFGGGLSGLAGKATALLAPLGLLGLSFGAVFELHSAVEQTTQLGIAVDKMRIQFGLTAEEGSAMLAVVDNVHVSSETLIKGFKTLTKNIGDYRAHVINADGSSNAFSQTVKSLNLKLLDQKKHTRDLHDIFLDAADKLSKMSNEEERAAAATNLFGKAGIELLPVLELGRKGILDAEAEAKKYGLVLTSATLPKIREFADKMNNLQDAVSGLKIKIGLFLIPILSALAEKVTEAIGNMQAWIGSHPAVIASLQKLGEAGVGFVTRALEGLSKVLAGPSGASEQTHFLGGKAEIAAAQLGGKDGLADSIDKVLKNLTAFLDSKSTKDFIGFWQQVAGVVGSVANILQTVDDFLNGIVEKENQLGNWTREHIWAGPAVSRNTVGPKGAIGKAFASGIDYVPYDMDARVHKGEKIVPAGQNRGGGGIVVNVYGSVTTERQLALVLRNSIRRLERAQA